MSNPNPWAQYDSYTDCSQGVCNIYCPQWCYLIFPPPPPSFLDDDDSSSSSNFSPLLIALIGILASAFILVSYYTLVSKFCHRHRHTSSSSSETHDGFFSSEPRQRTTTNATAGEGLNDTLIKSITVYKYRKGDGFVDGSDCSVCLSEFEEEESLRLLPKCNHAFHLPCIDTWLKSHSNCPLCRAFVTGANIPEPQIAADSGNPVGEINSVVVIADLETGSGDINDGSDPEPSPEEARREMKEPIRRSVSLNSSVVVSIADVLREIEDDEGDEESGGVGTSRREETEGDGVGEEKTAESERSGGVSNILLRSSQAMKRSVSTGRFVLHDQVQARDYRLPN